MNLRPVTPINFRHSVCGDEPWCQLGPTDLTTCFEVAEDNRKHDPYGINRRGSAHREAKHATSMCLDCKAAYCPGCDVPCMCS